MCNGQALSFAGRSAVSALWSALKLTYSEEWTEADFESYYGAALLAQFWLFGEARAVRCAALLAQRYWLHVPVLPALSSMLTTCWLLMVSLLKWQLQPGSCSCVHACKSFAVHHITFMHAHLQLLYAIDTYTCRRCV